MTRLLDKIIDVLPASQKDAVRSLLERKKKTGEITSLRSAEQEAKRISNSISGKLGQKLLDPNFAVPSTKISSSLHNENMENIYLDINALYEQINSLSRSELLFNVALNSEYLKSKSAIQKLILDATTFSLRKKYTDFNEVKLIDFNNSKNTSTKIPPAEVNVKTRLLELRPISVERYQLPNRTTRLTNIYTKTYSPGIKGNLSSVFPPELVADQKPETFWAEVILNDVPIKQVYELTSESQDTSQVEVKGPISELYFKFSHSEKINTIRILPFSEFPVKIIDVAYRTSNSSSFFRTIKDFKQVETLDWIELNFVPVFANEIRITLTQENYKTVTYTLPKKAVVNTDIFQNIIDIKKQDLFNPKIFDSDEYISLINSVSSFESAIDLLQEISSKGQDSYVKDMADQYLSALITYLTDIYSNIDEDIGSYFVTKFTENNVENELIEINKYEYIYGVREVELLYNVYSPTAYYSSQKYDTQATVSQVVIEVEEEHISKKTQWQDDYRSTSTEWEVEIGRNKRLPIHPRNIIDEVDGIPAVKDERLFFDRSSNVGFTRLGSYYSTPYMLKKEGERVPLEFYNAVRTSGSIPRLKITLTGEWFDPNGVYTVDYAVSPVSYNLDILENFKSSFLESPEKFKELGSDNDLDLSKYPFVNYEVVNTSMFQKVTGEAVWNFVPDQDNMESGQVRVTPTVRDAFGNILQTGNITGYSTSGQWGLRNGQPSINFGTHPDLSLSYFGNFSGINFGYFMQIMNSLNYAELKEFSPGINGFILKDPFEVTLDQVNQWEILSSGVAFDGDINGTNISGDLIVDYSLGIGVKTDDEIFTLANTTYEPLEVKVGSIKAKNITNYETLVHPAFNISTRRDNEYQYIHAGKKLYFNQSINGQEISVNYRWISEYLKINSALRCNKSINPDLTPKVNKIIILSNNIVI